MKILITGSTGLLGRALSRLLAASHDVTGLSRAAAPAAASGRHVTCDLTDARQARDAVQRVQPDVVIHAQAMSDVDRCAFEPEAARAQNVQAVAHVAQALAGTQALLLSLSSDYVFDGAKGAPYDETDTPHPISVYGASKLEGEHQALAYPNAVIVRTSTLFGPDRTNFCDHIVQRLQSGQTVEAFTDQVTSPTYSEDLAEGLRDLTQALRHDSKAERPRIYHMANAGGCSRVVFAHRIADLLGRPRMFVKVITMASQRRPAARPPYSALTSRHVPRMIGRSLRPWEQALEAYLRQRHWLN